MLDTLVNNRRDSRIAFLFMSIAGVVLFAWPLFAGAGVASASIAVTASVMAVPLVAVLLSLLADTSLNNINAVALVGVLSAVAAVARLVSSGFGGIEFVFVVVILAGRVLGARRGFLVGVLAVALSSIFWGGFGPWTAYQMLAVGWVAAGAGILPRRSLQSGRLEILMLGGYGVLASYGFGLLMNLWFWPIAVGPETSLSFDEGGTFFDNATRFVLYSLATSTLTWDTVRAITTVVVLGLVGQSALRALRRAYERV
ncbi:MAG: hypothetical protein RL247_651 [Actinomycetota bacterium]